MGNSVKVFEYGLLPPVDNGDVVDEQMLLGHRYRNRLTEIERKRRETVTATITEHPDIAPLQAELETLVRERTSRLDAIKAVRKQARKRAETEDDRAKLRELATQIKELVARLRERRRAVRDDVQQRLNAINDEALIATKAARATCGVYWGTYLLHEAAMQQASHATKDPPAFRSWNGNGRISVQIQNGMPAEDLMTQGASNVLHVEPVKAAAWDRQTPRGERRRAMYTRLWIRAASGDKKKPIWAVFPMVMHRPLPPGAVIKVATVHRRRRNCTQWHWSVQFTVSFPETVTKAAPTSGVLAMNLGFTSLADGAIRSGYLVGDDGWHGEILAAGSDYYRPGVIAEHERERAAVRVRQGIERADAITSHRTLIFNDTRAALVQWKPADAPEWYVEQASTMALWRSMGRMRRFVLAWAAARFPGDGPAFELADAWRARDEHLEMFESGLRTGALRDRREGYRILAAQMASRYRTLIVDTTDLRGLARTEDLEKGHEAVSDVPAVKRAMFLASGSELRAAFMNAFGAARVFKDANVAHQTATCHACGKPNGCDGDMAIVCASCGARYDRDENFCRNALKTYAIAAAEARADIVGPARWARIKAKKAAAAA